MTQQTSRGRQGQLRIANIGLFCPTLLATLIRSFRERFPKVQILLLQQNSVEEVETVLERAHLGIGFLACRRLEAFESWAIATASVGVIAATSVMQRCKGVASLRDFAQQPFLMLDPKYAPGYREWVSSIFLQTGFEPVQTIAVDSAESFFTLIRAGAGVAWLSELHVQGQDGDFVFRKLPEVVNAFPLSLVWHMQRTSPLVDHFLTVVRQTLPKENSAVEAGG